jgi:hypothetical protein
VPADQTTSNGTGTDVLYFASTGVSHASTTLTEFEATGAIGSVTVTTVAYTIHATGTVPSAPQAGTTITLNTFDDSVASASWSSVDVLWVVFTVGCIPTGDATTRSCLRVDAVNTFNNNLLQDAKVAVSGEYLFDGALTALTTGSGYLMVFGFSSAGVYPGIAVAGQNLSDAYGSVRGPIPVASGTSYETSGIFGPSSGIQLAAGGGKTSAWGAAEVDTTAGWTTEIVHFAFY